MRSLKKHTTILLILILVGAFLRFYKLDWGDGQFFHPDERNIVFAITNLHIENLGEYLSTKPLPPLKEMPLNPKFWAYGSLPVYMVYFTAKALDLLGLHSATTFEGYALLGRFFAALSSTLLIPLTYLLTTKILKRHESKRKFALMAAFWVTFAPGMLQFSHFMTFETFLTLEYMLILLLAFDVAQEGKTSRYILLGTLLGLAIGTKIISLALLPILLAAHAIYVYNSTKSLNPLKYLINAKLWASILPIPIAAFLASPFHVLDWDGFMNSLSYESAVANGKLIVFYTQQFIQTTPVVYQLTRVFPYILTIPLTFISAVAVLYFTWVSTKHLIKAISSRRTVSGELSGLLLLLLMIVLYLGFHMTMYVKWTRYMIPSLPLLSILSALMLFVFSHHLKRTTKTIAFIASFWVVGVGLFFWTIYMQPDTRMRAAELAPQITTPNSDFASEPYDLGAMPFNSALGADRIELLNVYELENDPLPEVMFEKRDESDYYLILSRRLYGTRFRIPQRFPLGFEFYDEIMHGDGWIRIMDVNRTSAHCNPFTLMCFGGQVEPDETFVVFDHPRVMIYENPDN